MRAETSFFTALRARIAELGGLFNAHLHLDRAGTLEATQRLLAVDQGGANSHISLSRKHSIIPLIHSSSCYDAPVMEAKTGHYLDLLHQAGTTRADTVVDVTADRVGLNTLESFLTLKNRWKDRLDLRLGAYNPLGFRDDDPQRWELLTIGAGMADFIGALPERDDQRDYRDHIGFETSCRRMLQLSAELDKPIHLHCDQQNHPYEGAGECIVRVASELGLSASGMEEPAIWLVHVISPSTYDEPRFRRLVDKLAELHIGVICCPSAAISMRQIRPINTPTFNSIARVLEFLAAGVHVRVGSDNICDITSPAGTTDLVSELFVLCNAVRYYDLETLAKLGAGTAMAQPELEMLRDHLRANDREIDQVVHQCSIDPPPTASESPA